MKNIEGKTICLRAVEPDDAELLYTWENDYDIWLVSGSTAPFSRQQMLRFIERQQDADIFCGQLRLMIETLPAGLKPQSEDAKADTASADTAAYPRTVPEVANPDDAKTVGAIDLFDFDPINSRVGVGILIYECSDRCRGYAADAVQTLCRYIRERLHLHQVWCNVGADNEASLRLFRKAGFTQSGIKRDWQWHPDGYHDEILMQKILE